MLNPKTKPVETLTIDDLLIAYRGNQSAVAVALNTSRSTIRKYIYEKMDVLIVVKDGVYKVYVHGRKNGAWKKGAQK
jgi:sulfur carrier protein ThiS